MGTTDISKQLRDIQSSISGEEIEIEPKISFSTSYKAITKAQSELNQMLSTGFDSNNIKAYAQALDGLTASQQRTVINSLNLDKVQKQELLTKLQSTTATKANTVANIENSVSSQQAAVAEASDTAQTVKNTVATTTDSAATKANTIANQQNTTSIAQKASAMASSAASSISTGWTAMPVFNKITLIISIVTTAIGLINLLVNKSKKSIEELNKEFEELSQEIQSTTTEFRDLKKSANEIIPKFGELAKGVNEYGENISLTEEEYEEFISLNNQLADLFPELNLGMNANGNSMLALSYNSDTLTDSLYDLIEAERELANQKIADTMPEVLENIKKTDKEYNKKIDSLEHRKDSYASVKNLIESFSDEFSDEELIYNLNLPQNMSDINSKLRNIYDPTGDNQAGWDRLLKEYEDKKTGYIDWQGILNSDELKNALAGIDNQIKNYEKVLVNNSKKLNSALRASLQTDYIYQELIKDKPELENALNEIIGGYSYDDFQKMGLKTSDEIMVYIQEQILIPLQEATPEVKQAWADLHSGSISPLSEQYKEALDIIRDYYMANGITIPVYFQEKKKENEELQREYETTVASTALKFSDVESDKVEQFFADNSIDSIEEYEKWKEILEDSSTFEEVIEKWKGVISSSATPFSEYFNSSEFEESKEKLLELAKAGELTPAILDTEEYNSLLGETGLLAEEAYEKIMKLVTANERLADMSSDLSSLANAYKEFKEDGFASAETIASLEKFKDLDSYDDFAYTVGSSKTSATEKQDAFNTLVTEYMNREQALGKLTEATKDYYITQLKSMGISNAEEVVTNKLTAEKDALALKEKYLAETGLDLFSTSKDNCQAFLDEKDAVYDVRWELFRLNAEEKIFNESELDASQKITELQELAEKYGIVVDAISGISEDEHWRDPLADNDKIVNEAREEINEDEYKIKNAEFEAPDDSGSDAKSSADNTFDWIEVKLERLSERFDEFKTKGENVWISFTSRIKAFGSALNMVDKQIKTNQKAYDKYMAKAKEYGAKLPKGYVGKIQKGELRIEDIQDENLRENIENYQKWYEKAQACKETLEELKKTQTELKQEKIEMLITKYDKLATSAENANNKISNWIELKEAWGGSAGTKNYDNMNNNIITQVKNIEKQNNKLVELQKTVKKGSEAWWDYQQRIDDNTSSLRDLYVQMTENAKAAAELAKATADKKVEKIDSKDELYQVKAENATNYKTQNGLINKQINNVDKRQDAYDKAVTTSANNLDKSANKLNNYKSNKSNAKLVKEVKKYTKAKKRIPNSLLKKIVKSGDENLLKAVTQYNAYYDSLETNKVTADLYRETSKQDKADLAMEKFNNIQEEYENKRASNEYSKTKLNSQISLAEEQGIRVNTSYYKGLIDAEKKNQASLIEERKKLQDSLNNSVKNGSIKEGSEGWYEAQDAINNVTNAIDESTLSVEQYNNAIRQIEWDTFDDAIESMKRLNSEADFYINLMAVNNDLVDEDTGNFTEYGNATFGLHNANYKSYLEQAKEYEEEYNDLLAKIARGEESIADENVVNRLRQLEDAQRDAKISAENELKSIIDLVEQGYQAQLNALKELIDEYKELQNAEKEAYEYEKSIAEKTKSISALQKQLAVLGGSDTEESKAQIQKLKVQLEEAQDDLKDTEYNKYLSDSQNMLDEMYGNYEEFINEKLDNTNLILGEIQNIIRSSSSDIIALLRAQNGDISDELKDALGDGSKQTNITVNKEVEAQKKANEQRKEEQRKQDEKRKQDEQRKEEEKRKQAEYEAEKRKYENSKADLENAINKVNNDINDRANQMNKLQDRHNKTSNKKEKEKLKSDITNLKKEIKELKNKKSSLQKELSSLTIPAYAKGSKRITEDQIALVAEDGSELQFDASSGVLTRLGADDMVFTNEQAQRLWELSKGNHLIEPNLVPIKMPSFDVINKSNNAGGINVSINELNLPNVTNYEEFKTQLIKDNKFEKAVQSMTIDRVNGGNSLSKFKFK